MKLRILTGLLFLLPILTLAQLGGNKKTFTKADTLRGTINKDRDWWDVLRYDIEVTPDYTSKSIQGKTTITFRLNEKFDPRLPQKMQIDLQEPMRIDSVFINELPPVSRRQLMSEFTEPYYVLPWGKAPGEVFSLTIFYHGKPKEANNAPWDGGWVWSRDSLGRPWMSVAVQGLGASSWFPCKDHQSDKPDNGASLTVIVPDTLVAVGNGRLTAHYAIPEMRLHAYRWEVKNPINAYNIVPSIGKYANWTDTLMGRSDTVFVGHSEADTVIQQRRLDLSYWVLDYNLERSKAQFQQVRPMMRCFEHWFGPYPFYEDSYKLVETPFLGMEHQSNIAYGNGYRNGYRGIDLSRTGWGNQWDFIIVHESGHEWFGNSITSKDIADMWIHEGFTNYSEIIYTGWLFGKQAGNEYNQGIRRNIRNDKPIIGPYGVNQEGSGDMYYKAANMIHIIRQVMNDDARFLQLLRGMNSVFFHQTVTTRQVEEYIIRQSGIDFSKLFDQYLRTTQIPRLEFYFNRQRNRVFYRWRNCVEGFNLPLVVNNKRYRVTTRWSSAAITKADQTAWSTSEIEKLYYIRVNQVTKP